MGGYDGEIRIKTSMELKQLDKDIKEAEKMLREYEKESERLAKERAKNEAEIGAKQQEAMEVGIKRNRIKDILDKRAQSGQSTDTGIYGDLKLEYAQLDETYKRLSGEIIELENKTKQAMDTNQNNIESTKNEIGELANKYNQAKQELLQYNEQLEQQKKREQEVKDIKRSIDNVGNSVKRVTGQMIRWSLSLVGINGMMSLVSRSLTLLKKDNKELNANLNYISFALANAIKPIVEKIVNLVLTLMQYVNYIWVKWFGHNLFKDSGAKEYEQSMKNSSKSAKQIRKDLMVFDEVNKLNDDSSSSADSGFVSPSIDLSKVDNIDVPKWVKWIADHKDDILRVCDALMALLVFKKTIEWLSPLANFFSLLTGSNGSSIVSNLGGIATKLGTISSIIIIGLAVKNWIEAMEKTHKKVDEINKKGGEYTQEFVESTDSMVEENEYLNHKRAEGNKILKKATSLGTYALTTGRDYKETLDESLKDQDLILQSQIKRWRAGQMTKTEEEQLVKNLITQRSRLKQMEVDLKKHGYYVGNIKQYSQDYLDVLYEIRPELDKELESEYKKMGIIPKTTDEILAQKDAVGDTNEKMDYSVDNINRFGLGAEKSKNSLVSIADKFGEIANTNLPDKNVKVNVEADQSSLGKMVKDVAQTIARQEFIMKIKADPSGAGQALEKLVTAFGKTLTAPLKAFGLSALADNMMAQIRKYASAMTGIKLARGGIIHNPGAGVSLGSNIIGGEGRNAEAVLPLDDRTMDRLGQSIARHMTINATMINQMNGRTLSREVKQIMSENNFANNL